MLWLSCPCPTAFQQIEVDYAIASTEQAPPGMYQAGVRRQVAVVRLYGVNDNGNSVCAFVHGFEPYFLVEKPYSWNNDHTEALKSQLNVSPKRTCWPVLPELWRGMGCCHKTRMLLHESAQTPNVDFRPLEVASDQALALAAHGADTSMLCQTPA